MKNSYIRRPQDFKRRIIKYVNDRENILNEEHKWLDLIKDEELGKRYYNLTKHHPGHWSHDPNRNLTVSQKISIAMNRPETKEKLRNGRLGKKHSEETKEKISKVQLGKTVSEETRVRMSCASSGRKHSDETRSKMSDIQSNRTEEHRLKLSEAGKRRKMNDKQRQALLDANLGNRQSEETKKKRSNSLSGRSLSETHKDRIRDSKMKSYSFVSPSGEVIHTSNLKLLCENNSLSIQGMYRLASGKRLQYKGWTVFNH